MKKCLLLLPILLWAIPADAQTAIQRASAQFRTAERAEAELYEIPESQRSNSAYLRVIRSYERVYLITPHTAWADNALTTIARLYEAMKDPRNAIRTLQFLLKEYPQSPYRDLAERDVARLSGAGQEVPRESTTPYVENIRFWEENKSIRITVDISGNVAIKTGSVQTPNRFFVDISPARLNQALIGKEWAVDSSRLQKIRVAQFDLSVVRVVLDGVTTKDVVTASLKDPNRVVLDIANASAASPTNSKPITSAPLPSPPTALPAAQPTAAPVTSTPVPVSSAPAPVASNQAVTEPAKVVTAAKPTTSAGDRSLIRSLGLKLSRVVIDPGHGGHDTGGIGPTGFTEKELVLDLAKRLKTLIETQLGAEVVLTRQEDDFVALENRTQIANDGKADVFVSIHANYSSEKAVRGVETFFLNLNTQSRDALATATRENAASEKKIHELQDLLQKIVMNDKEDESRELAQHVQKAMSKRTNAGTNRGVKQAPFVVLIGATMPSVLAEVSFISNPEEEKRLKTSEYRQEIAESLLQGIKSYAETLSSLKAAN
jgi:N-acetylmuramoyl-L-alanine amidase